MTNVLMNIHIVHTQNVMISCTFTCSPEEHIPAFSLYKQLWELYTLVFGGCLWKLVVFVLLLFFGTAILNWLSNTSSKY